MVNLVFLFSIYSSVFGDLSECLDEYKNVGSSFGQAFVKDDDRDDYGKMAAYSGIGINDLGNYKGWKDIDVARYVLLIPQEGAALAFWGPKSCKLPEYQGIIDQAGDLASQPAPESILFSQLAQSTADLLGDLEIHFPTEEIDNNIGDPGAGTWVMLGIVCFLGAIWIAASILDFHYNIINQRDSTGSSFAHNADYGASHSNPVRFFLWFSAYSNYKRLFRSPKYNANDPINMISFIWVFSIGWNIFKDVWGYRTEISYVSNPEELFEIYEKKITALAYGGIFSMDACLWLTGMLVTYLFLKEIHATAKIKWHMLYFHRFWSIYPAYIMTFFIIWAFTAHMGDGPLWYKVTEITTDWADYWWANLFFINNFLPDWKTTEWINWSWYIDCVVQLFIITIPILVLNHRFSRSIAWIASICLMIIHIVASWAIADYQDYNAVVVAPGNNDFKEYIYYKPYWRCAPWAIGIICGVILFSHRHYKETHIEYDTFARKIAKLTRKNAIFRYFWMLAGLALLTFCIFIAYGAYKDIKNDFENWSHTQNVMFIAWSHAGYSAGLAAVIMPILLGEFRVLIEFMNSEFWVPMARLSITAYMLHRAIIYIVFLNDQTSYYYNIANNIWGAIVILVYSFVFAIPIWLISQGPALALERTFIAPRDSEEFIYEDFLIKNSAIN